MQAIATEALTQASHTSVNIYNLVTYFQHHPNEPYVDATEHLVKASGRISKRIAKGSYIWLVQHRGMATNLVAKFKTPIVGVAIIEPMMGALGLGAVGPLAGEPLKLLQEQLKRNCLAWAGKAGETMNNVVLPLRALHPNVAFALNAISRPGSTIGRHVHRIWAPTTRLQRECHFCAEQLESWEMVRADALSETDEELDVILNWELVGRGALACPSAFPENIPMPYFEDEETHPNPEIEWMDSEEYDWLSDLDGNQLLENEEEHLANDDEDEDVLVFNLEGEECFLFDVSHAIWSSETVE
ncbi:hypothetical protein EJ04DRAFT_561485 [Polyplosphaeria fusca]|uniref:Uncharacterized protein n=1 Tax=Polyplosphaeria fusca TaxID=682080 RepID=A0A9P4R686_9PLEO|nr:hypothetical protein EJ04DRAFT_561485 [Polyplosphaeria fusca]